MRENITLVALEEENQINRNLLVFINSCPDIPVTLVRYEMLATGKTAMALSIIQGAYITRRYICGGYQAECQFKIVYRIKADALSVDEPLKADETLNAIGAWATQNIPFLGDNIKVIKTEISARSSLFARYENGDEDHQILMKLIYEVI